MIETTETTVEVKTSDALDESSKEINTELREKFKEETLSRMQAIHKQFVFLTKIAGKRSVDYTEEDVEKMFNFLEKEVEDSKKEFMKKFTTDQNDFKFTW